MPVRSRTRRYHPPHVKFYAMVERIDGDEWMTRVWFRRDEVAFCEMSEPIHPEAKIGTFLTIHQTKRGDTYLYWPRTSLSRSRLKKIRISARAQTRFFMEEMRAFERAQMFENFCSRVLNPKP